MRVAAAFDHRGVKLRSAVLETIVAEEDGSLAITLDDGSLFTLTARADRIEINGDGTVTLVDYKTGGVPGMNEIRVGFSPQLTLEAAMVAQAAFANLPAGTATRAALYLKLGGQEGGRKTPLSFAGETFEAVVGDHWQGLMDLLNQFRHIQTPYLARPFVKFQSRFGNYDHLARVAEWAAGQESEG